MTISSSLNAGVAGLAANASRLATIADNIANSATYGYKRAVADFSSLVIESGEGTYSAGGVRVSTQRLIDQPGALASTNNATDLAVRGRGFLPVTTESSLLNTIGDFPLFLATTGSFRTDEEGYLRTSAGTTLMGWPAAADGTIPTFARDTGDGLVPVQINVNQFTSEPTTRIDLGVNLPATETEFGAVGDPLDLSVEYFDNLGTSQAINIQFTPNVPTAPGSSNTWTVTLTDSASNGAVIGEYTIVFDDTRGSGGTIASVTTVSGGPYDPTTGSFQFNVAGGPIAQLTSNTWDDEYPDHADDLSNTADRSSKPERPDFGRQPNVSDLRRQWFDLPLGRRRRTDRRHCRIRSRGECDRRGGRTDPADPDAARLFVER